ncbi:hypothetical protein MSG28_006594 [Choristoneura fumiferana]|uniref:Uncharacterized protein n=1 Tax=Choristoneura fumiferana TaxID=7141 RepID=A0ACC0JFM4_CHOFU|nr:hypothetical protein MSG28_006594 [Choristoneura fumiferana]
MWQFEDSEICSIGMIHPSHSRNSGLSMLSGVSQFSGDYLRDKYEGATEVKVSRRGKLRLSDPRYRLPTAQDLGSLGTTGVNATALQPAWTAVPHVLCRGYNTKKMTVKERCGCKFHWCCASTAILASRLLRCIPASDGRPSGYLLER